MRIPSPLRTLIAVVALLIGAGSTSGGAAVAGFESASAVLGPQAGPDISQLPSASTAIDGGVLLIGFAALSAGLALLRRREN